MPGTAAIAPSDHVVVAALNFCLDLEKWNDLPVLVQERIGWLLSHHRLGKVCFMGATGFGLRIFDDSLDALSRKGDEVTLDVNVPAGSFRAGMEYWMRCPASFWEEHIDKTKAVPETEFVVKDKYGTLFYREPDEDVDEDDRNPWVASRYRATRFKRRSEADSVARRHPDSVVIHVRTQRKS